MIEHQEKEQKPFRQHVGIVAPMLLNNIDTDQIIPSREMKKVSKEGLGEGLFAGQRYLQNDFKPSPNKLHANPQTRIPNPDFILNKPAYSNATILLSCKNFGCGSSREHAAWSLKEYGVKAIVAESFGSIFRINCLRNGIVPISLTEIEVKTIYNWICLDRASNSVTIDVEHSRVILNNSVYFNFILEPHFQEMLVNGLDFISSTLRHKNNIDLFILKDKSLRPWAYL